MMLQVPASYRDYLHDRTIRSVVDHLLKTQPGKLPSDIEWDEVRAFHQACLSAQKVKTDRALFLLDLWEAIWKPTLEKFGMSERNAWSIEDMKKEDSEPGIERLWSEREGFYRWYVAELSGHYFNIYTQVSIKSKAAGIQLYFSADSENGRTYGTELTLAEEWASRTDEYYNRYTREGLFEVGAQTPAMDVTRLAELAEDVFGKTLLEIQNTVKTADSQDQ